MLVEIVDDDLRIAVALQLDDDARVFVRLIADRGDVAENFFVHQLGDPLDQRGAIHVVRNLGDDDLLLAALDFLDAGFAAHLHAAAAGLEILLDAVEAADRAAGREIRPLHMLHQLLERDVRIVDLRANAVDDFAEIVRRHVRRHADGDAGAAVDEQIRKRRGENGRLGPRFVVVRNEIDRVLVHVGHERGAEMRHARLGVTHRRRRIAFDRTEIALAVDQPSRASPTAAPCGRASDKSPLRRADDSYRWCRRKSSRTYDACRPGKERQIVHRVKNAALRWLQSVARIRQRARNDDRHRVIEERPRYFVGDIDRINFFVRVVHQMKLSI